MEVDPKFQTPPEVCRYMASLIHPRSISVLEPTAGLGNLKKAAQDRGYEVTAPDDFFLLDNSLIFDTVLMNPPFSVKTAYTANMPASFCANGMRFGYRMLLECMNKAPNVIALMPWFTISDSDVRLRYLKKYGLISITALPRKTFEYARIQTCVLELSSGYTGPTEFKVFDFLPKEKSDLELLQTEFNF